MLTQETTTEPVAPPTEAELDAQIEAAAADLALLEAAAETAQAAAEAAQTAFEAEPTAQAHTDAAVAAQRALNARKAAFSQREGVLAPLRHKRQRLADDIEREAKRRIMDPDRVTSIVAEMRDAAVEMVAKWDASIPKLIAVLEERHHATRRAIELGVRCDRLSLEGAIEQLNNELATLLAGDPKLDAHKSSGRVILGDTGSAVGVVNLSIHRPAAAPGYVRHR